MTDYMTDAQYFRTLFIGFTLFLGIVFGFPVLQSITGVEFMQWLVAGLVIGCVVMLAYMRIDKAMVGLFSD